MSLLTTEVSGARCCTLRSQNTSHPPRIDRERVRRAQRTTANPRRRNRSDREAGRRSSPDLVKRNRHRSLRPHVTGLGLDVRASSTGLRPRTRRSMTTGGDHHRAHHEATGRTSASRRTEAGAHRRRPELLRASRALVGRHRFEDPTFHIRRRVDVSGAHPLPARHLSGRRAYGRRTLWSAAIPSTSVPPTALARRPGEELAATS